MYLVRITQPLSPFPAAQKFGSYCTGENILKSGNARAGLEVPGDTKLVITSGSTGSLKATGGMFGAGIGGGGDTSSVGGAGGTITINDGTVNASSTFGAGIGGKDGESGTFAANNSAFIAVSSIIRPIEQKQRHLERHNF